MYRLLLLAVLMASVVQFSGCPEQPEEDMYESGAVADSGRPPVDYEPPTLSEILAYECDSHKAGAVTSPDARWKAWEEPTSVSDDGEFFWRDRLVVVSTKPDSLPIELQLPESPIYWLSKPCWSKDSKLVASLSSYPLAPEDIFVWSVPEGKLVSRKDSGGDARAIKFKNGKVVVTERAEFAQGD